MKNFSLVSTFGLAFLGSAGLSHAVLLADFDGGGTGHTSGTFGAAGPLSGIVETGGPTGDYYHLLDNAEGGLNNTIGFAATSSVNWTSATFTMDLRADNIAADGFSVAFLDTATHGATGAAVAPGTPASGMLVLDTAGERGQYGNSVGVGFRTFNGTNASVNFSGADSGDTAYPLTANVWGSMMIQMDRNTATGDILLDATMYSATGQGGTATNVFTDYAIAAGTNMAQFRVQLAGRTGGATMDLDVDNLNLTIVPEPSAALLVGLAGIGVVLRRKRR